jgi:hypothetical protein
MRGDILATGILQSSVDEPIVSLNSSVLRRRRSENDDIWFILFRNVIASAFPAWSHIHMLRSWDNRASSLQLAGIVR